MASLITLASGSSRILTVTDGQSIVLNNSVSSKARLEIVAGPGVGRIVADNHHGRAVYGPFGVGTISITALSGDLRYELSGDDTPLADESAVEFSFNAINDVYLVPEPSGADDAALFAAAIASGKAVIQMRRGTYLIGTTVALGAGGVDIVGRGRGRTTIKLKDASNLAAAFTPSSGASGVEFRGFTFDGNQANQTAGAPGGAGQLVDMVALPVSNFKLLDLSWQNLKSSSGIGKIGQGSSDIEIARCRGISAQVTHITLDGTGGCSNVNAHHNYFTEWNGSAGVIAAIWVLNQTSGSATYRGCSISDNYFLRSGNAATFCIESVATGVAYHAGFSICRNVMDGAGSRGTGISGYFSDSDISHNRMLNGGDDAGAWTGWRNGLEIFGGGNTIIGNYIENGGLVLTAISAAGYSDSIGNEVAGNTLKITQAASTGIYGIQFRQQTDLKLHDNSVTITLSGSATLTAAIGCNVYGGAGTSGSRCKVYSNIVRNIGTAAAHGIRQQGTSTTDTEVDDNHISGFIGGLTNQSNANDVNLRLRRNTCWDNTTPVSGTSTGVGYIDSGNIKLTGGVPAEGAVAFKQVTTGQLLALNATPQTIIAAPGAGLAIIPRYMVIAKPAGTAYAGIAAGEDLVLKYTDASGAQCSGVIEATGFLDQATAQVRYVGMPGATGSTAGDVAPVANAAVVLHLLTGEIITGTSALNVRVVYDVVPTVFAS